MIYSKVMAKDDIPFLAVLWLEEREDMLRDAIVDGVQVPDIE